jgi:hypothetical protein
VVAVLQVAHRLIESPCGGCDNGRVESNQETDDKAQAAYAGTLSRLSRPALDSFTGGYRTALTVLAGACLLGLALSLARNAGHHPEREPAVPPP